MKRLAIVGCAIVAFALPLSAQLDTSLPGAPGISAAPKVKLSGSITRRDGDVVEGVVIGEILPTWHINSAKPLDEFAIPTKLEIDPATAETIDIRYPQHELKSFTFTSGNQLAVYEGTIQVPFKARLLGDLKSLNAKLYYQACDDKVCLPPTSVTTTIDTGTIAAMPSAAEFTPLSAAPKDAKRAPASLFTSDVVATFASRGLPLTLLAVFVLGLALNLTPCVYPLIPITIGYFSSQSEGSRGRRALLSAMYVIGIAITYSALGVFSALSGRLFGAWLQLPIVLGFFALLMLVMASSMFGLFEIRVPRFIADRSGGQAGVAGALTMGLLIGIVAAPCVGPFVISLIALVSQLGSPLLGFLLFFVLALGLGIPYLFLGIFSSGLSALPRSGMWMVQVKRAMGFVLIAMAFYFMRPIIGEEVFRWGVALSLLTGALFLFVMRGGGGRVMRLACASLLLVAGAAFAIPRERGAMVQWDRYDGKALAAAAVAKKPVVIDFYADWCLPCKELDATTFSDKRVAEAMNDFIRVKADLTAPEDPMTEQLTKQYAIVGVPTIVFLDSSGQEIKALRLTGVESPEKFLERLALVK